jgi:succinyl-diaminopimelate desuccinylase
MIRIPSQGGIDSPTHILEFLFEWAVAKKLDCQYLLSREEEKVAVLIEIAGKESSTTYCLNACADTAPIGDSNAWKTFPFNGDVRRGWLFGRGSADSKVAIAIFLHIAEYIYLNKKNIKGRVHILFDGDEHTGNFGGIKSYVKSYPKTKGVMIGYPGNRHLNIGARGFYRAKIEVFGTSAHSGDAYNAGDNAIYKASKLVQKINEVSLPTEKHDRYFGFGPSITVTGIRGGQGYSIVPDICHISVDCRLTPSINKVMMKRIILDTLRSMDKMVPSRRPSKIIDETESWPAYRLDVNSHFVQTIATSASEYFKHTIKKVVAGPSNIGNYLAGRGIEATCGFGVSYKNLHGANECIRIQTIKPVYLTYRDAIIKLLT